MISSNAQLSDGVGNAAQEDALASTPTRTRTRTGKRRRQSTKALSIAVRNPRIIRGTKVVTVLATSLDKIDL